MAAVLYNCHFPGFWNGRIFQGATKGVCMPGLNCYSCPGAVFACPLGGLQKSLSGSLRGITLYMIGTLLLFGILFGRLICGFFCPFGLLQELLYKLPLPKFQKGPVTRILSYLKYWVLAVFVILFPIVKLSPGFCKYICPAGTLEAGIPLVAVSEQLQEQVGWLFSWKVYVLLLCIIACSMCYRAFCRFLCPLGAIYSLFNPISFFGVRVDVHKCTGCNACIRVCKSDVKKVGDRECIHCGECMDVCPEGAIEFGSCLKKREKDV